METEEIKERINSLEYRIDSIEHIINERDVLLVKNGKIEKAKHAAKVFLSLAEKNKGKWKGTNSAVEEVKSMRQFR